MLWDFRPFFSLFFLHPEGGKLLTHKYDIPEPNPLKVLTVKSAEVTRTVSNVIE